MKVVVVKVENYKEKVNNDVSVVFNETKEDEDFVLIYIIQVGILVSTKVLIIIVINDDEVKKHGLLIINIYEIVI